MLGLLVLASVLGAPMGFLQETVAGWDLYRASLERVVGAESLRRRRQVGPNATFAVVQPSSTNPYPGSPATYEVGKCVLPCMNNMQSTLEQLGLSPGLTTSLDLTSQFYNEDAFQNFCRAYTAAKACIRTCPDSVLKATLGSAFAALEYLCVEHYEEFLAYLPCYRASDVEIQRNCGPLCNLEAQMRSTKAKLRRAQQDRDLEEMSLVMDQMCKSISCQFTCLQPIVYAECGNWNASVFFHAFTQQSFTPLEEMLDSVDAAGFWPASCRRAARLEVHASPDSQAELKDALFEVVPSNQQSAASAQSLSPGLLLLLLLLLPASALVFPPT